MKRAIAILLVSVLLFTGCSQKINPYDFAIGDRVYNGDKINESEQSNDEILDYVDASSFKSLSDPALLEYVSDNVFANLECEFASDDYIVENVSSRYLSEEYISELAYNSLENVYFGYTLSEIQESFGDQLYVYNVGTDGTTHVELVGPEDNSFNTIVKNVAIGSGVIILCVTVSLVTGGTVSVIFAAAAKTAAEFAISSAAISGVAKGIVTGIQTGDFDSAISAGALAASEGFMIGAISGALAGGISSAISEVSSATKDAIPDWFVDSTSTERPSWRTSEKDALSTFYEGGRNQVTYINGEEVRFGTPGGTRPDIVLDNVAVEVKNYNLRTNVSSLCTELKREIVDRIANLPSNYEQEIVLDARGQNLTSSEITNVVEKVRGYLQAYYPDIVIRIMS